MAGKTATLHDPEYSFATYCKNIFPGKHTGSFLSESDVEIPSDIMTSQRKIAYFLYPTIDIRIDQKTPKDCLVIYKKTNPLQHIPSGFKIVGFFNEQCALAVKENP